MSEPERIADPNRLKNQDIEKGVGITTKTDDVLTQREPGDTSFETDHEKLDRDENEHEDTDRK
jgi:hypothetical protein